MDKIRWYELPEARQLASLGRKVSKAARQRLQWMLFYFFNGRNVARTCRHFGASRQTFYRWKRRFDRHDPTTLEGHSHRPRKVRQPTWTPELAERVLALRKQYPRWAKDKLVVVRTLPSYAQRRVLPGAGGLRRGRSAQSTIAPLGTHLQPGQAS